MTIKSRLSALKSQAGAASVQTSTPPDVSTLRSRLTHLRPERIQGFGIGSNVRMPEKELAKSLGGELLSDGLIRIERSLPLSEMVGTTSFIGINTPRPLPGEENALPAVYIDTETTGLSGGSGTLAFLVGIAYVCDEEIRLIQILITQFSAEARLLSLLKQLLPDGHRLVSYNGKSYDVPLLISRFRMQGLKPEFAAIEHLDLLHPVRRLFARCWDDCRLTTAENKLLNFQRKDDLPGSEAPEAWFSYLRSGDAKNLIKVVEHNRQDILSLAAIHTTMVDATLDPLFHDADIYGLSRWLSETDETQARELLLSNKKNLCDDGTRLLAHLLRRNEQWDEALLLWEGLAAKGCLESVERLAKYHEHVSKNLDEALRYCNSLPGSTSDLHRINRIKEKLYHRAGTADLTFQSNHDLI